MADAKRRDGDYEAVDEDAPLPFPSALARSDFLAPSFDPVAYLSSLPHRHQTLEDLRAELRDRSAAISAELLLLVNSNYTAFLSLGNELKGGDDRVEDMRVALLAFRRQVSDVKAKVRAKAEDAAGLNAELAAVRADIELARKMMDLAEGLAGLEESLALEGGGGGEEEEEEAAEWVCDESEEEDDDDEEGGDGDGQGEGLVGGSSSSSSPAKLAALGRHYRRADALAEDIGRTGGFVAKMEERLARCRRTIIMDLDMALREAREGGRGKRIMGYLAVYRMLGAEAEAVKAMAIRGGLL